MSPAGELSLSVTELCCNHLDPKVLSEEPFSHFILAFMLAALM